MSLDLDDIGYQNQTRMYILRTFATCLVINLLKVVPKVDSNGFTENGKLESHFGSNEKVSSIH